MSKNVYSHIEVLDYNTARQLQGSGKAEFLPDTFIHDALELSKFKRSYSPKNVERSARFFALKFAKKHSKNIGIDSAFFSNSLWLLIYREFCNLIPVRLASRDLKDELKDKIVLINLYQRNLVLFQGWQQPCDLLPIYKYLELRKNNVECYLVYPDKFKVPKINITLNRKIFNCDFIISRGKVFCSDGIKSNENIQKHVFKEGIKIKQKIQAKFFMAYLRIILQSNSSIFLKFKEENLFSSNQNFKKFTSLHKTDKYFQVFQEIFLQKLKKLHDKILLKVSKFNIQNAHLCDHPFLIPSMFSGAVKKHGGMVTLWPHSANQILALNNLALPNKINYIFKSKHTILLEKQGVKAERIPYLMVNEKSKYQKIDYNRKLNVVIILNATKLNEASFFSLNEYIEMSNRLVDGLRVRKDFINILFKRKGNWGDQNSLSPFIRPGIEEVFLSPSKLQLSNMVFIFLNQKSAAILEGLTNGVPSLIVKETEVEDYLELDEVFFPCLSVERTLKHLDNFKCRENIRRLHTHQFRWAERNIFG